MYPKPGDSTNKNKRTFLEVYFNIWAKFSLLVEIEATYFYMTTSRFITLCSKYSRRNEILNFNKKVHRVPRQKDWKLIS
jgi:hypothetical protein